MGKNQRRIGGKMSLQQICSLYSEFNLTHSCFYMKISISILGKIHLAEILWTMIELSYWSIDMGL